MSGLLVRRPVSAGEAYLVPAGTLHAVGPGALLYEIQQPSDITYRCDDWGRPVTASRALHVEQSLAVARTTPWTADLPSPPAADPDAVVIACEHFVLERLRPTPGAPVSRDPAMASVHALTAVGGSAVVRGEGWTERLALHETLVIPADAGAYRVAPAEEDVRAIPSPCTEVLLARAAHQLDDSTVRC